MGKRSKREKAVSTGGVQSPSGITPAREPKGMSPIHIAVLALAVAGILLTIYLTYIASFEVHPAFCSEGSGCDLVQSSRWATFLGFPMALWGWLTYMVIAGLVWRARRNHGSWTEWRWLARGCGAITAELSRREMMEM